MSPGLDIQQSELIHSKMQTSSHSAATKCHRGSLHEDSVTWVSKIISEINPTPQPPSQNNQDPVK